MCDPHDVGVVPQVKSPFTGLPTIFVYERVPAGVGFAERLFTMRHDLLRAAAELAQRCTCEGGCPSCVGPAGIVGERGKLGAINLALGPDTRLVPPLSEGVEPAAPSPSGRGPG
jgi:DEAD/DEAH box helicase domain-containing protein